MGFNLYDVTLTVQIARIQTLADGTPRIVFDCQEGQVEQVAMLMAYQANGGLGRLVFSPDIGEKEGSDSYKGRLK